MKTALAILAAMATSAAQAAWVPIWYENQGGTIYLENATIQRSSNPRFLRVTLYTDYTSAINSDRVCHPSGADCQWKKLNVMVIYDFFCNGQVRLMYNKPEFDSGPSSQSYDRYSSPAPRQLVPQPQAVPVGGTYDISKEPSFAYIQNQVCRYL